MITYERFVYEVSQYPQSNKSVNMGKIAHLVDLKKMASEDPQYFDELTQEASLNRGSELLLIDVYKKMKELSPDAGQKLIAIINQKMKDVKQHIMSLDLSAPRITDIKEYLVQTKKYGSTETYYDFVGVQDAIAIAYHINTDNVYGSVKHDATREILQSEFGFSQEDMRIGADFSPLEDNLCAKMYCALDQFIHRNMIPYMNHWHHIKDRDFSGFNRGGTAFMSKYSDNIQEHELFKIFRKIYTLECSQHATSNNDSIMFTIDW